MRTTHAIRCTAGKIAIIRCAAPFAALLSLCAAAQTIPNASANTAQSSASYSQPLTSSLSLSDQIAAILSAPAVARDHWGIAVTALDGTSIYSLNDAQLFHPASNAKLFTTAAALALLGPANTFQTTIAIDSPIQKGVLHGNLYLVGGGDANFGSSDVPYVAPALRSTTTPLQPAIISDIDDLANQVVKKGIRTIVGDIVGDDRYFVWQPYGDGWSWDDLLWGYGAPVSGLSIHDNQLDIAIASATDLPSTVSVQPSANYYAITDSVVSSDSRKDNCTALRYSRPLGSMELLIQGSLYRKSAPCTEHLAIQDPAEYAAAALKLALETKGVRITGSAKPLHAYPVMPVSDATSAQDSDASLLITPDKPCVAIPPDSPSQTVIARHASPTLAADIQFTNKVSQNLHAELMLRNLAAQQCHDSPDVARRMVRTFLSNRAGIDPDDFAFYDGSGLSTKDLVTPRAIAKLLSYAANDPKTSQPQPWFAIWKSSLPIGGVDGSLESRFTQPPLKGHIFAKTGTIGEARALSGYLDCASGRTVIFSILVDNHLPGTSDDRDAMDRIVAAIHAAE
jgi:D-alanyl-D-alanine carboxypeptidase/D-alanyl-D-alanine-endopeptidase (penicillin-binding protein 4)